ncbi:MAG: hypothetical protein K8L91_16865 [Anaerolineae bacterium]|nr:hypothetical protein [Anaerolineae bacterium]
MIVPFTKRGKTWAMGGSRAPGRLDHEACPAPPACEGRVGIKLATHPADRVGCPGATPVGEPP